MQVQLHPQRDVTAIRTGVLQRRDFLRNISATGLAAGAFGWPEVLTVEAANLRKRGMACILLWMQGGPSQFETFSPKPTYSNGASTGAISTSVPGIQISENLPATAKAMQDICLIRSMSSKEGSHPRGSFLMHTGMFPRRVSGIRL